VCVWTHETITYVNTHAHTHTQGEQLRLQFAIDLQLQSADGENNSQHTRIKFALGPLAISGSHRHSTPRTGILSRPIQSCDRSAGGFDSGLAHRLKSTHPLLDQPTNARSIHPSRWPGCSGIFFPLPIILSGEIYFQLMYNHC